MNETLDYDIAIATRNIVLMISVIILISMIRPAFHDHYREPESSVSEDKVMSANSTTQNQRVKKAFGIDVSHYQGDVDWSRAKTDGVGFTFIKATQGTQYIDPMFNRNRENLKRNNIIHGAYHFFDPQSDAKEQAEHFINAVGVSHELRPVLDIETQANLTAEEIQKAIKVWLDIVEESAKCKPIIYTNKSYWENNLGSEFLEYPLWIAEYREVLSLPKGVSQWAFWQNSETGRVTGVDGAVDTNLFYSGEDKLGEFLCR